MSIKENSDGSVTLTTTISKDRIADKYEAMLEKLQKTTEVKGFRKGKAPKKQVEKAIGEEKIYQQAVNELLPEVYQELVEEHDLQPIISPRADFKSAQAGEDWEVEFTTCELPEVELGDYKEKIKDTLAGDKIWTPGEEQPEQEADNPQAKQAQQAKKLQKVLDIVNQAVEVSLPDILIENDVTKKISNLIKKTEQMGVSLEQYAQSVGKSIEEIKQEARQESINNWKTELALNKIAAEENINVNDEEIDKFINNIEDKRQKEQLKKQRYTLASMIRRRKALEFLQNL